MKFWSEKKLITKTSIYKTLKELNIFKNLCFLFKFFTLEFLKFAVDLNQKQEHLLYESYPDVQNK